MIYASFGQGYSGMRKIVTSLETIKGARSYTTRIKIYTMERRRY
jgi:hypothetical protein